MCLSFLINFRTRGPHTLLFSKLSPCLSKDKFHPLRYLLTSDNLSKCFLPFVQMSHQSSHVIDSNRLAIYSDNCIVCQVTRPLTLKIAFLKYILNFFLILFLTYKLRKYCFGVWGQIFEMEILIDLHVLRTPETENHIFSVWSVYLCLLPA